MRKKIFLKATALLVCFGFLILLAPGLIAVEKKAKSNSKAFLERPAALVSSLVSFVDSIFHPAKKMVSKKGKKGTDNSSPIVRPTDDLDSDRPSVPDD